MREEPLKSHGIRLDQYFPSKAALQNKKINLLEETVGPGPYVAFFPEGLHLAQKLCCCRYHLSSKTSKQYVNDLDYYRSCPTSATSLGAWHAGCFCYTPRSKNAFSFPRYPLQFQWWVIPVHVAFGLSPSVAFCLSLCNGSRIIWGEVPVVHHTYIKPSFPKEVITQIKQCTKRGGTVASTHLISVASTKHICHIWWVLFVAFPVLTHNCI